MVQADLAAEKCSIRVSSAAPDRKAHRVQFVFGRVQVGMEAAQVLHQHQRMLLPSKNQIDMKAEKSLSCRLSRRNISVAGRPTIR